MEQINSSDFINKEELIYWIDKQFVQDTAQARIGRILNGEELTQLVKLVEFGLCDAVFDTVKIAIDEVSQELN
jgi:hypothetical protein